MNPPRPDVQVHNMQSGNRVLVCSDGLNGMLRDGEISQVLTAGMPTAETCRKLVELANLAGGNDNITVLLLDAKELPPLPEGGSTGSQGVINDMTQSQISRMVNQKNIWIGLLALIVVALLSYEVTTRFFLSPDSSNISDSTSVKSDTETPIDSAKVKNNSTPKEDQEKPSGNMPSGNKPSSQKKPQQGITVNPEDGSSNPSNPTPQPSDQDTAQNAPIANNPPSNNKPSAKDLLKDSSNKQTFKPTLIVPTRQEFEESFADIIDIKAKALKTLKCLKSNRIKDDEAAVDDLIKQSGDILNEILAQGVTFKVNKLDKLPAGDTKLALLNQKIPDWKSKYLKIGSSANGILEKYKNKKFYDDCK